MPNQFLRPKSVEALAQGEYNYRPVVKIFEADSAAGLEALLSTEIGIQGVDPTKFTVIESIEYQAVNTVGSDVLYSALVHATEAVIV